MKNDGMERFQDSMVAQLLLGMIPRYEELKAQVVCLMVGQIDSLVPSLVGDTMFIPVPIPGVDEVRVTGPTFLEAASNVRAAIMESRRQQRLSKITLPDGWYFA